MSPLAEAFRLGFAAGRCLPTQGFEEIDKEPIPESLFDCPGFNCCVPELVYYLPEALLIEEFLIHLEFFERRESNHVNTIKSSEHNRAAAPVDGT